ncbi:MAG: phenylacetate--CoA ligase family protein, partial [Acutalibacteraceae bacterium]|nr:phenylacetate--CoA ligase family protein [Acutalibacteraceae bacterium]
MKISELQLQQVNHQIHALVEAGSFYGKKLEAAGITGVSTQEEFEALPFSEKADLRDAYPLGLMTAPE